MKSVHLELGGKTPNIVFGDADLEQAIAGSLFTAFYNTGQICTSGSRLLVQRERGDEIVERSSSVRADPGRRPGAPATQLGPLISAEQYQRVTGYIEEGRRGGARLALGGGRPSAPVAGRLLRRADGLRGRHAGDADRQGGDLRAGPVGPHVRGRGGRDPDRQRRDVRPGSHRLDDRPGAGLPGRRRLEPGSSGPIARTTCRSTCRTRATRCPASARTSGSRRSRRSPTSRPTASTSAAGRWDGRNREQISLASRAARDGRDGAAGGSPSTVR